jgi:dihydrodipicolinate reductase
MAFINVDLPLLSGPKIKRISLLAAELIGGANVIGRAHRKKRPAASGAGLHLAHIVEAAASRAAASDCKLSEHTVQKREISVFIGTSTVEIFRPTSNAAS